MGARLQPRDVAQILNALADGYYPKAIERKYGYNPKTSELYYRFYKALKAEDFDAARKFRQTNKVSEFAMDWARVNGYIPDEPEPEQVELVVGAQIEDCLRSEEEPVPQNPQDFTLSGLDALWRELTALNMRMDALTKTLDTMTNSLVIELNAINKGLDKLAERWQ